MTRHRAVVRVALMIVAVVLLAPEEARADVAIPTIAVAFGYPLFTLLGLAAIIAIEAVVLWGSLALFGITLWHSVTVASVTNVASTFVGIPITWLLLLLVSDNSLAGHDIRTRSGQLREVTGLAPWIVPHEYVDWDNYQGELDWILPGKLLTLMIPFFVASWLMERWIAIRLLGEVTAQTVGTSVFAGNLVTYGLMTLIVVKWLVHEKRRAGSRVSEWAAENSEVLGRDQVQSGLHTGNVPEDGHGEHDDEAERCDSNAA